MKPGNLPSVWRCGANSCRVQSLADERLPRDWTGPFIHRDGGLFYFRTKGM